MGLNGVRGAQTRKLCHLLSDIKKCYLITCPERHGEAFRWVSMGCAEHGVRNCPPGKFPEIQEKAFRWVVM